MVQIGGWFLKIDRQNIGVEPWNFGTLKKHPNLPQYKFFRSFGQKTWKWEPKFHSQPLITRPLWPFSSPGYWPLSLVLFRLFNQISLSLNYFWLITHSVLRCIQRWKISSELVLWDPWSNFHISLFLISELINPCLITT